MRTFFSLSGLGSGVRVSLCTTIIGMSGLISYLLMANEKIVYMQPAILTIAIISVLAGALRFGFSQGRMGWLKGGLFAATYILAALFIRKVTFPGSYVGYSELLTCILLLIAGVIGGIAGINLRELLNNPNVSYMRE